MAQVVVEMTSQEAAAWAGIQRLARGTDEFEKSLKKTSTAAKEAAVEQKKLEQAAMRVFEETRTPMERHGQQMAKLNDLFKRGLIDVETFGRATKQSAQSLDTGFGSGAISKLTAFAGALGLTTSAVGALTAAWQKQEEFKRNAAAGAAGSALGEGELIQNVSSKAEWDTIKKIAREIYAKGAVSDQNQASSLAYQLAAVGQLQDRDFYTRAAATGLLANPTKMVESVETVRKSMGDSLSGNVPQIISQAFQAASMSKARPEVLLEATARSGTGARALGLTSDQTLAATAVLTNASDAATAGTQMRSMLFAFRKMASGQTGGSSDTGEQQSLSELGLPSLNLKGKNIRQQIEEVRSKTAHLDDASVIKMFGRKEGFIAYETLRDNIEAFQQIQQATLGAKTGNTAAQKLAILEADPENIAARQARATQAQSDLAGQERWGTGEQLWQAVQAERDTWLKKHSSIPGVRSSLGSAYDKAKMIGADPALKSAFYLAEGWLDENEELRSAVLTQWLDSDEKKIAKVIPERYRGEMEMLRAARAQQAAAEQQAQTAIEQRRAVPTLLRPDDDR